MHSCVLAVLGCDLVGGRSSESQAWLERPCLSNPCCDVRGKRAHCWVWSGLPFGWIVFVTTTTTTNDGGRNTPLRTAACGEVQARQGGSLAPGKRLVFAPGGRYPVDGSLAAFGLAVG